MALVVMLAMGIVMEGGGSKGGLSMVVVAFHARHAPDHACNLREALAVRLLGQRCAVLLIPSSCHTRPTQLRLRATCQAPIPTRTQAGHLPLPGQLVKAQERMAVDLGALHARACRSLSSAPMGALLLPLLLCRPARADPCTHARGHCCPWVDVHRGQGTQGDVRDVR